MRLLPFSAILSSIISVACCAEDVVTLATGKNDENRRITGTIVDYNGEQLKLRRSTGSEISLKSARVIAIEATWTADHVTANKLFAEHDFAAALDRYRKALSTEKRQWVQRRIVAQRVWCLKALARHDRACTEFLLLNAQDPTAQYLAAITLPWSSIQPSLRLEREATTWLISAKPVERLVGASWLLAVKRGEALAELQRLAGANDARVAHLASAQVWRTQIAAADADRVDSWQNQINRMPRELRAGAWFTVGRALAFKKQHEKAALTLMRLPILFPKHRRLSAAALRAAATQLEELDRGSEAVGLYRELVDDFVGFPEANEAMGRLQALSEGDNN